MCVSSEAVYEMRAGPSMGGAEQPPPSNRLQEYVMDKLRKKWSPDQISVSLRKHYPNNKLLQISHETIYLYIYLHSKKELKDMLITELRDRKSVV